MPGSLTQPHDGARAFTAFGGARLQNESLCPPGFAFKWRGYPARSSRPLLVFGPFTDQPSRPALKLCSRLSALCSCALRLPEGPSTPYLAAGQRFREVPSNEQAAAPAFGQC